MRKNLLNKNDVGYLFIAPYFIAFTIFVLYPIVFTLHVSFTQWDGISNPIFSGLSNYVQLFHNDLFLKSIFNTIFITLVAGIFQITLGIVLAFILNQSIIKKSNFFKALFYFPGLVTAVSLGILFSLMFDWQAGSVNKLLIAFHIISSPINWQSNSLFSQGIIMLVLIFQYFGLYTILFSAGIKSISPDIVEASMIDGANRYQILTRITLPLIKPIITYCVITIIIGGMQMFDVPYVFGKSIGEPGGSTLTIVNLMYNTSFRDFHFGEGAAISYILFLMIVVFSVIYLHSTITKEER